MGGHPWFYFVPFVPDVAAALFALRQREFAAGRYNPVIPFPQFPIDEHSPAPGPQHKSMEIALAACGASGTRSILDVDQVGYNLDFGVVSPISDDKLLQYYGTSRPTHEMLAENMEFFEMIERGHGVYIVVYEAGEPKEILFAGLSFD